MPRLSINHIVKKEEPIVCLTAYTAQMARLVDPYVDLLLVGDSLGMVLYGFENTLSVTLDMMIAHGRAVVRSSQRAVVVVDMPYGTYEESPEQAFENANLVLKNTEAGAIKLEGGQEMAATIRYLVQKGIPVMGHVGLLPQSVEKMGGYKIQGRSDEGALQVKRDACAVAEAGAFAMVIEGTVEAVARDITLTVAVPTIGIGASASCDGQILVLNDVLGLTPKPPRFAKRYANLDASIAAAVKSYAEDVRAHRFPADEHVFGVKK